MISNTTHRSNWDVTIEAADVRNGAPVISVGPLVLSFLCLAIQCVMPVQAQQYTLKPVGNLGSVVANQVSRGTGINNAGDVIGYGYASGSQVAFLYNGVTQSLQPESCTGPLLSCSFAEANAINQSGTDIVGWSEDSLGGNNAVLFMPKNGSLSDLGSLCVYTTVGLTPIPAYSIASAVNSSGTAVGISLGTACGSISTDTHAALFSGGSVTDLGTLGGNDSEALGINDSGVVVGDAQFSTVAGQPGYQNAFYWTAAGGMMNLGTLGGPESSATAINASGLIVGWSINASNATHAFMWTATGSANCVLNGAPGCMTDLGSFAGGTVYQAAAVNSSGQVVGYATVDEGPGAFLYSNGVMQNLNSLLTGPLASSVTLEDATGINDGGEIVANGYDSKTGNYQAYLLTPVAPAVTPLITGTLGANGWYVSATTLSWHVTGFPKPTTSGCDKVAVPNTTGTPYTCSATNQYGTTSNTVTIMRDTGAPAVKIAKPASGATYKLNQKVPASYTCADDISGVATCTGNIADGADIPTAVAGPQTFSVTAIDNAGNTTAKSVTYTVQ